MKYKVGDKVRIQSLDCFKERGGLIPSWLYSCCGRVMTITAACIQGYAVEEVQGVQFKDFMIEGLVEEETKPKYEDEVNGEYYSTPQYLVRPSGYQFVDENGNIINATKIVLEKKKKEYPKTYQECCDTLYINSRHDEYYEACLQGHPMQTFARLLICRNAYWKMAGEEMGLDKPWKPDWEDVKSRKYAIVAGERGKIVKGDTTSYACAFVFPTPKMRDAFRDNFDPDIEICKEFL